VSEVNLGPITTGTHIYPLEDLSVAQDSGWRDLQVGRVEALKVDFKDNKYGTCNFSKPSVVISSSSPEGHDEEIKSDIDGLTRLDNGKSTIQALKELKVALNFLSCPGSRIPQPMQTKASFCGMGCAWYGNCSQTPWQYFVPCQIHPIIAE